MSKARLLGRIKGACLVGACSWRIDFIVSAQIRAVGDCGPQLEASGQVKGQWC